jgi:multisubunit Na+/H+ antiporter MnhB subunit
LTGEIASNVGLALLVLAVASWTITARDAFAAVVGFVAYGLLLALVWVRLAAVDVALTEAAIGSGLTGGLLVAAAARLRPAQAQVASERPGVTLRICAGLLCAGVSAGLAAVVLSLPDPAPTLAPAAAASLPATGLGNPVTGVLIAFRAFDTLLEKVVLTLALVGVWSLAPDRLWGGRPGLRRDLRPDGALSFVGRLLPPVGIVVAVHFFWVGADAPGGAFQSGTILAAMWILARMAGLVDAPAINRRWLRLLLVVGAGLFLAVGLAGFFIADAFLAYPEGLAKPLILVIEAALILSIAATLGMLVAGPPERKEQP